MQDDQAKSNIARANLIQTNTPLASAFFLLFYLLYAFVPHHPFHCLILCIRCKITTLYYIIQRLERRKTTIMAKRNNDVALRIQTFARKCIGRKAALLWQRHILEVQAVNALYTAAASGIARHWKSHRERERVALMRHRMSQAIDTLRQEQQEEDQEEYFRTHRFAKWQHDRRSSKAAKMMVASKSAAHLSEES
jgi:hypothetical protein